MQMTQSLKVRNSFYQSVTLADNQKDVVRHEQSEKDKSVVISSAESTST